MSSPNPKILLFCQAIIISENHTWILIFGLVVFVDIGTVKINVKL